MISKDAEPYFKEIIEGYVCGDINWLLSTKKDGAGPLLNSVVNGIDTMGGIIYDFKDNPGNSRQRSLDFMTHYMKMRGNLISGPIAKFLYVIVRCGMAHQGVPKNNIRFFVQYNRVDPGGILYVDQEGVVHLNVVEFAHAFLEAVSDVRRGRISDLKYVPVFGPNDQGAFSTALPNITDSHQDFESKLTSAGGPAQHSSGSAKSTPSNP